MECASQFCTSESQCAASAVAVHTVRVRKLLVYPNLPAQVDQDNRLQCFLCAYVLRSVRREKVGNCREA